LGFAVFTMISAVIFVMSFCMILNGIAYLLSVIHVYEYNISWTNYLFSYHTINRYFSDIYFSSVVCSCHKSFFMPLEYYEIIFHDKKAEPDFTSDPAIIILYISRSQNPVLTHTHTGTTVLPNQNQVHHANHQDCHDTCFEKQMG